MIEVTSIRTYFLVVFGLMFMPAWGQLPLFFTHLSVKEGLSQNIVHCIHQDKEGFMWFGTDGGLNRYDGTTFKVFQPDPDDPLRSLRNNTIWSMAETSSGQLWVATLGGGIHHIDKQTGVATAYQTPDPDRNLVYQLRVDKKGILWGASLGGLNQFDPLTKQYKLWTPPISPGSTDKTVWSVLEDSRGTLWVGTATDLYQLNRQRKQWTRVVLDTKQPDAKHLVISLHEDAQHVLWVTSLGKGLFHVERDESSQSYRVNPNVYLPGHEIFPNAVQDASSEALYVGTHGQGLKLVNKRTGQYTSFTMDAKALGTISNNSVWAIKTDRANNLWIGTDFGINLSAVSAHKFQTYQREGDPTSSRLPVNNVTTLCEDRQGKIWLSNDWGIYADGLHCFDRTTGRYVHYTSRPGDSGSLLSNQVMALFEDHTGVLWAGTPNGLQSLTTSTGRFTRYPIDFNIHSIEEDTTGNLWLGGDDGLVRWNRQTKLFTHYLNGNGSHVNQVLKSRAGHLWIALKGKGLGRLDPQTGKFTLLSRQVGHPGELNDSQVLTLYEDPTGILWVGTDYGGLNRYDPHTGKFRPITMRQGLPSNHIVGLLGDQQGHLWLATAKGLCRFDPRTNRCLNFDQRDGLQDDEFYSAYARGKEGELLFGGPNGFTVFKPAQVRLNTFRPPVYITSMRINGRQWPLSDKEVKLAYNENFIDFNFVGLNYAIAEKNQYAYRLEGLDKAWNYCGTRHFAQYTDLSPGQYTFRVKVANNDHYWNQQGATITITIAPPWWRTWWAYFVYLALILGTIWAFVVFRSRKLRKENELLEETVAQRTQQVLMQSDELKAQRDSLNQTLTELKVRQTQLIQREKMASLGELTAGIAHEIQNPLNFVNNFSQLSTGLVEELDEELDIADTDEAKIIAGDLRQNLQRITHHSDRASAIVRNMLEHSRTSTGQRQPTDLNALAEEYLKVSHQGWRAKDNEFTCELVTKYDPAIGLVELVPQDISRVLLNLYNNAFYAVRERQRQVVDSIYQPTVTVSTLKTKTDIEIRVSDNGPGIPESVKAKIFQPFFTTKPTGEGTGLGLSLSYDIVAKGQNGSLLVESQEGEGTTFVIQLPLLQVSPI